MHAWLIRIGVFCLFLGIFLVSPLLEFLPVDLLFINQSLNPHYRVVPATQNGKDIGIEEIGMMAILGGLALLCGGLILKQGRR